MKAVVGRGPRDIVSKLLGLLSSCRQEDLSCDLIFGEGGEICVVPKGEEGGRFIENGPALWEEISDTGDALERQDGVRFSVATRRTDVTALEAALCAALPSPPRSEWRRRLLFALPDEATLGEVVRALLQREQRHMTFGRVKENDVHPGAQFLLLVREASTYVAMQVQEEGMGQVFYEAVHPGQSAQPLGLFLPWGSEFPLLQALTARLDVPCLRRIDGRAVSIDIEDLAPIDAVLSPVLPAAAVSVETQPAEKLRIEVPLRLTKLGDGRPAEPAELWHVEPNMIPLLAEQLACPEERLDTMKAQAVRMGESSEIHLFIWAPTADETPPGLNMAGVPAFARARRRLRELFLPERHAILPTLSNDTLRQVFSLSPERLTVAAFDKDGGIIQYSLEREAFRSLRETLVSYNLERYRAPLSAVVNAADFDFEPVVVTEAPPMPEAEPVTESVVEASPLSADTAAVDPMMPMPETSDTEISTPEGPTESPVAESSAAAEPEPAVYSESALSRSVETVVGGGADEQAWLSFLQAALGAARLQDARVAVLHLLSTSEQTRAESLLGAVLDHVDVERARRAVATLAERRDAPFSREEALELGLSLTLAASAPPADLTAEERRALAAAVPRMVPLNMPRLTWITALAVFALTRDDSVLYDARLAVERSLLVLTLAGCVPDLVVERVEALSSDANRAAVDRFAETAELGPAARVWLHASYAIRLAALGMSPGQAFLGDVASEVASNRDELGQGAEQVLTVTRAVERMIAGGRELEIPQEGTDAQRRLRTVLIEEGYLPPLHLSDAVRTARCAAALATLPDAEVGEGLVALFADVAETSGGLSGLLTAIPRFVQSGHPAALALLGTQIAARLSEPDGTGTMHDLQLTCLDVAVQCALSPTDEHEMLLSALVERVSNLDRFDAAEGVLSALSAIATLPVESRRSAAASLYGAFLRAGIVRDLSRREAVSVQEQRLLLRLVQLLVVPADEAPEGDRIRRAEWRDLRATVQGDLQRLTTPSSEGDTNRRNR